MFRRLALAPGRDVGLDLAARLAEQSTATADVALSELADASLVRPGGEPDRYSFHDLLLLFAGEKLEASSDDVEACRQLMVRWLLTKAITASRFFHPDNEPLADDVAVFGDLGAAERWLDREADSWLGALRLAVARERHADVLELAHAMHWYSDHRGAGETWLEVYGAGLDAARVVGTAHDVAVQLNFVTWTLGFVFLRYRDALQIGEEAIALTERENDVIELAWAHLYRSVLKGFLKDLDDAVSSGQRALELFQSAGYETGVTIACNAFGDALVAAGRVDDGLRCQREAIARHLAVNGPRGGSSDDNLASIYLSHSDTLLRTGKVGEAGRAIDQAERLLGPGSVWGRASSHHMRGKYLLAMGHDEKAYDELSVAMELVKSTSRRVQLLTVLADLAEKLGRSDEAREHRVRGVALLGRPDLTLNRAETAEIAAALGVPLEVFVN
jgi:tetratricopeptide (TPR) repeat protein